MGLFSPLVPFIRIIWTRNVQSHIHGCVRPLYCQMEKADRSGRTGDLPHWPMERVCMVRRSSEESWRGKNNQRRNRRAHQGALQFWRALIWSSVPLLPCSPFPRSLPIQPLQPLCCSVFPLSNPHTCLPHLALRLNPWVFYPVIASFFNLNP